MANLLKKSADRIAVLIGGLAFSLCLLVVGGYFTFFVSPGESAEAKHIANLPLLDAQGFAAAAPGQEVVVTGRLEGNAELLTTGFVAYVVEEWVVESKRMAGVGSRTRTPVGTWQNPWTNVPALTVAVDGGTVMIAELGPYSEVRLGGALQEYLEPSDEGAVATYQGTLLQDGSTRTRGFFNGDPITVVGKKREAGDLLPAHLFAGDRAQLVESVQQLEQETFNFGVVALICSPLVLVLAVLAVWWGRKQAQR